jgi:uncharacterized integral membrane protein
MPRGLGGPDRQPDEPETPGPPAAATTAPSVAAEPRTTSAKTTHPGRTRLYVEALVLIVLVVLVIALALDNRDQARVGWIVGDATASVVWIVLAAAFVGWLAGIVTHIIIHRRTSKTTT